MTLRFSVKKREEVGSLYSTFRLFGEQAAAYFSETSLADTVHHALA
jgi:hypothetical protein